MELSTRPSPLTLLEHPQEFERLKAKQELLGSTIEKMLCFRAESLPLLFEGFSSGADVAVDLGITYGGVFGQVFAQSPGWLLTDRSTKRIENNLSDTISRISQASSDRDASRNRAVCHHATRGARLGASC